MTYIVKWVFDMLIVELVQRNITKQKCFVIFSTKSLLLLLNNVWEVCGIKFRFAAKRCLVFWCISITFNKKVSVVRSRSAAQIAL